MGRRGLARRPRIEARRRARFSWEALETRLLLANFTVTNTNSSGPGSFQQAIVDLNTTGSTTGAPANTITFKIAGSGPQTIRPTVQLPDITKPVLIDAWSQGGPGYSGPPLIELDASRSDGTILDGLHITAGNSTVQGFNIHGFGEDQILLDTAGSDLVQGNYLGTDISGTKPGRSRGSGLGIVGISANTIGGGSVAARNVISGNDQDGLDISGAGATGNLVLGNFIGTNVFGTGPIANKQVSKTAVGISVFGGASGNTIGGSSAEARNIISGNPGDGVDLFESGTINNLVLGNYIGTNVTGTAAVLNGTGDASGNGIAIYEGASGNSIGGSAPGAGNLISGNLGGGISISQVGTTGNLVVGNLVGTDVTGTTNITNGFRTHAAGISLFAGTNANTIGGTTTGARNLISGNEYGALNIVGVGTTSNLVLGNLIGTDISGTTSLNNGSGPPFSAVAIQGGASANTLGGSTAGARNVISGNSATAIAIFGGGTTANVVLGNYIGIDVTGNNAVRNGTSGMFGDGIDLYGGATANTIGGTTEGAGNVIAGNRANGIGISQPGTSANVVIGNLIGTNSSGMAALPNVIGVVIYAGASNNTIGGAVPGARNVISGNSANGVGIADPGTTGNLVIGNWIGTGSTGVSPLPNAIGITVYNGASGNSIGGTGAGDRNIISGNTQSGISIIGPGTGGNLIRGNYVGTAGDGNRSLPNGISSRGPGIAVYNGASNNTIGGTAQGAGNVISGNASDGVRIYGAGTFGNRVLGNWIGTNFNGTAALPNGSSATPGDGVAVYAGASGNSIGGTAAGAGNVLSGNARNGVSISETGTSGNMILGNLIGTNASGIGGVANLIGVAIFAGASGNTVGGTGAGARNVISGNTQQGVAIIGPATTGTIVRGNFIGTDRAGTSPLPNGHGGNFAGLGIFGGASANTIGGTANGAGNVISGNVGDGLEITGVGTVANIVRGNLIGTDRTGTRSLGNGSGGVFGFGVDIYAGASANTIGGTIPGAGNVISGNKLSGVRVIGSGTSANIIQQNRIGTDAGGSLDLGNRQDGVLVDLATDNQVGGTAAGAGNLIAFNVGPGVRVESANRVSVLANSIYSNIGLGIQLLDNANRRARPPVLTLRGSTIIGRLAGPPRTQFLIEIFSSPPTAQSFLAQGKDLIGSLIAKTSGGGRATFRFSLSASLEPGSLITATATDAAGNTSPFSARVVVPGLPSAAAVRAHARLR